MSKFAHVKRTKRNFDIAIAQWQIDRSVLEI